MIKITEAISGRDLGTFDPAGAVEFLKRSGAVIAASSFRYALRSGLIYLCGAVAFAGGRS